MSGHGDRGHQRYRERSRSPRRNREDYRPSRSRYESNNTSRGGHDRSSHGQHEGRARSSGGPSSSHLPDLPKEIEIPKTGCQLPRFSQRVSGTIGTSTQITTNHYEVISMPVIKIYQYDIRMVVPLSSQHRGSEKVTAMQQARILMHDALRSFWGPNFAFDGVCKGWSPDAFVPVGEERSTTVDLSAEKGARKNEVEVSIRNVGKLNIGALVEYLEKGRIDLDPMGNPMIEPLLKWLNAIFRQDPASRFVTRPNSNAYFERTPSTTMSLKSTGDVLEAMRGVFQTVQIRFGRMTLNVDTATTAFWSPEKNLVEMIHALAGATINQDIEKWFLRSPDRFFSSCGRLLGIFFNVKHLRADRNARKIRLSKWSRQDALQTTFDMTDKKSGKVLNINVNDYFRATRIHSLGTLLGERFKEPLQGAETADFIKFATAPAFVRTQQITENVKKLHWHEQAVPKAHGLSVKTTMLTVPGRVLPAPTPQYGRGTDPTPPLMGRWNLRGKQFYKPSSIKSWGMMYFAAGRKIDDSTLKQFAISIAKGFSELGAIVPRALPSYLIGNPQGPITDSIQGLIAKAHNDFGTKPQLLMFMIHGASERLYKIIKNVCEIQFGVASQVMLVEKALSPRGQPQYIANIGLKVNVKLGGVNSIIQEPLLQRSWMMLGGDTSHPSPAQLRMNPPPPTFSALSASWNTSCTAYSSVASAQFAKEQLITDFEAMAKELLGRFQEKNKGKAPDSILYFRDGLSEGEFSQILASEAEPLKEVCASLGGTPPKITVVVVIKRHHTRLFPTEKGDKNGNVLPGTVVENSAGNDIYLVAHPGLQGTVRPTRYAVLLDQNNLSANDFQRLTNNLCWTYARSTTAVSVVPPVYYADQACERAKLHLRETPNGEQILGQVHEDLKYSMYWQ
ncbi:MAG: hypothetical protein M1837_000278 [Sclerophora amabilis]|nr:MAG: hypothetical protein M1837_000278 [Sclerophora amabilis]